MTLTPVGGLPTGTSGAILCSQGTNRPDTLAARLRYPHPGHEGRRCARCASRSRPPHGCGTDACGGISGGLFPSGRAPWCSGAARALAVCQGSPRPCGRPPSFCGAAGPSWVSPTCSTSPLPRSWLRNAACTRARTQIVRLLPCQAGFLSYLPGSVVNEQTTTRCPT